jgi:hypothetical protein
MTKAQLIFASTRDTIKMDQIAETNAIGIDQDWEKETTTYTFEDGSKIVSSGQEVKVL